MPPGPDARPPIVLDDDNAHLWQDLQALVQVQEQPGAGVSDDQSTDEFVRRVNWHKGMLFDSRKVLVDLAAPARGCNMVKDRYHEHELVVGDVVCRYVFRRNMHLRNAEVNIFQRFTALTQPDNSSKTSNLLQCVKDNTITERYGPTLAQLVLSLLRQLPDWRKPEVLLTPEQCFLPSKVRSEQSDIHLIKHQRLFIPMYNWIHTKVKEAAQAVVAAIPACMAALTVPRPSTNRLKKEWKHPYWMQMHRLGEAAQLRNRIHLLLRALFFTSYGVHHTDHKCPVYRFVVGACFDDKGVFCRAIGVQNQINPILYGARMTLLFEYHTINPVFRDHLLYHCPGMGKESPYYGWKEEELIGLSRYVNGDRLAPITNTPFWNLQTLNSLSLAIAGSDKAISDMVWAMATDPTGHTLVVGIFN